MVKINDDQSICVTRGDTVYFSVLAENSEGKQYQFKVGDVVRIKVFGKKDCSSVLLCKEFPVTAEGARADIFLSSAETRIGDVINKPKDLWYEIELNPNSEPQTIVGYDENGPKIFRLYPEGKDI